MNLITHHIIINWVATNGVRKDQTEIVGWFGPGDINVGSFIISEGFQQRHLLQLWTVSLLRRRQRQSIGESTGRNSTHSRHINKG